MNSKFDLARSIIRNRADLVSLVLGYTRFVDAKADGFWGSLTEEEEETLSSIIKDIVKDQGPIIEFGTLFGTTTLLIAGIKGLNQKLITLDNFSWNPFMMSSKDHERFARRCLRYVIAHCDVELVNKDISEFKDNWRGGCPALVFWTQIIVMKRSKVILNGQSTAGQK